jgi:hypothetical protein
MTVADLEKYYPRTRKVHEKAKRQALDLLHAPSFLPEK